MAAVVATGTSSGSAAATRSGSCFPKASHTIVQTARARAYAHYDGDPSGNDSGWYAYACLFSVGRPVLLGPRSNGDPYAYDYVSPILLAGRYVAFSNYQSDDHGEASDTVKSIDLRNGRRVHRSLAGFDGMGEVSGTDYGPLLDARGSIAWIVEYVSGPSDQVSYEVWKADRPGYDRIGHGNERLDVSGAIDPGSLRLGPHQVTWVDGGVTRTAAFR